jgi:hypothetical protein
MDIYAPEPFICLFNIAHFVFMKRDRNAFNACYGKHSSNPGGVSDFERRGEQNCVALQIARRIMSV